MPAKNWFSVRDSHPRRAVCKTAVLAGEQVQDELAWSSQVLVQLEKAMRNFDAHRRPMTAFGGPGGAAVDPIPYIHVEGITRFWAEIYNVLPPSRYSCERMQTDSLDPVIREGDIVLFDLNQKAVASGICLIETAKNKVVVRVQNRGGKLMASYPAHHSADFEIDQNAIVGVAVWAFRKITLRDT